MTLQNSREFEDRMEYDVDGEHFLDEFLCVNCPECGQTTDRVVTSYSVTYYIHIVDDPNHESYCEVKRGKDLIPDALLFVPYEGVSVISLTEGLW